VEIERRRILFDTGADGDILLSNIEKLKTNPQDIEDIFISHLHWDHTGGLSSFLQLNNKVKLWVPSYLSEEKTQEKLLK